MNAPTFGRDVAPLGPEVGPHGLCPWGLHKGQEKGRDYAGAHRRSERIRLKRLPKEDT